MNIDLIAMLTMLVIMILFGIGLLLSIIIIWSDGCTTDEEQYQEDLEQMKYLKEYQNKKSGNRRFLWKKKK